METDAAPQTAGAAEPTVPPTGRKPIHWLLEGVFIVISVLLGFGITEFGKARDERNLAARMLASIRAEVEFNRAALAPFVPIHRAWQEALERQDLASGTGSAVDALFATRPPLPAEMKTNVPLFRHAAWDTALATGNLRLIDYDLAAGLSEMYGMQSYAGSQFARLFSEPAFFDASNRATALRLTQTTMTEMRWAEETLLALYDTHLSALRAGGGR